MVEEKSPVLFLIFNRPSETLKTFEAIRRNRPKQLFIASDGPRPMVKGEEAVVIELREEILSSVDWDCDVSTLFSTINLGCGLAVSGAISRFFCHVNQGIILEDDCLAHPDFFRYCTELLDKYHDSEQIQFIGGTNFQNGKVVGDASYYFSNYCHVWGWATWKRVWEKYSYSLQDLDKSHLESVIRNRFRDLEMQRKWYKTMERMIDSPLNTWDYQLVFSIWNNGGISVIPNANLISNIGFGTNATHTFNKLSVFSSKPIKSILPLRNVEPIALVALEADERYFYNYESRNIFKRVWTKMQKIFFLV